MWSRTGTGPREGDEDDFSPGFGRIVCNVYVVFLVSLGTALAIIHVLLNEEESTNYDLDTPFYLEVFLLYVYGIGFLFLLYLHAYLLHQKGQKLVFRQTSHMSRGGFTPTVTPGGTMRREPPAQVDTVVTEDANALETSVLTAIQADSGPPKSSPLLSHGHSSGVPPAVDVIDEDGKALSPAVRVPAIQHGGLGTNLYSRIGVIVFALGTLIYDGFQVAEYIEMGTTLFCRSALYLPVVVVKLAFTFFQAYFVFKSHRVVINKHRCFVQWGLMHMMGANLCTWLFLVIKEAEESIRYGLSKEGILSPGLNATLVDGLFGNSSNASIVTYNSTANLSRPLVPNITVSLAPIAPKGCHTTLALPDVAKPYLLPCVVEYSLICALALYKIFRRVGTVRVYRHSTSVTSSTAYGDIQDNFHKSHKGLFCGLLGCAAAAVAVGIFFALSSSEQFARRHIPTVVFFFTEGGCLAFMFIASLVGIRQLSRLEFQRPTHLFEDIILYPAMVGVFVYDVFEASAGVIAALNPDTRNSSPFLAYLPSAVAGLSILQVSFQSIFILDGYSRQALTEEGCERKPGRSMIVFLIVMNLVMWVINTFEIRKVQIFPMPINFYGEFAWHLISHVCVPLMIFYRFHSAACLAEIWAKAYLFE